MADTLAEALNSLEDSLLNKPDENEFLSDTKQQPHDPSEYPLHASQKSGFDFEVNLQPEKILEVLTLPDGSKSYRMKWKDTWIHEGLMPAYQHLVDEFWKEQNEERKKKLESENELKFTSSATDNEDLLLQTKVTQAETQDRTPSDTIPEASTSDVDNLILMDDPSSASKDDDNDAEDDPDETLQDPTQTENQEDESPEKTSKKADGIESEQTHSKTLRKRKSTKPLRRKFKKPKKSVGKATMKTTGDSGKVGEDEKENLDDEIGNENNMDGTQDSKSDKYVYPDEKGPCTCNICGKVISNKYGLREHQTVVHFKNGKFACDICGKRVTNKRALNLHMTSHSSERKFVCDMCGSSHKTKGNLNYHIKTMHTMIKNFRCDICFKTFKVQAELKEHCFSTHATEGVITCIVCKKKLTTALSIYTHSVMHSGAREHECSQCGYAFKTATGLKEHMVTHSEEKPVRQCPHCERKFYSRSQYNAHVMRHTADGSLITYKCPICDVKFQHKSSYNRHVIRHQPGGDLEFPKQNPYLLLDESELPDGVCHKCRKHYNSKSGFYLHLKKCRDGIVQQFQCPFCERGCSNRSSLKRHIQRRHKGMEFEGQSATHNTREVTTADGTEVTTNQPQATILTSDGIQYQSAYFDHGYGNQITAVDASQLTTVDVQLLIDTAAAQDGSATAAQILSNVGQVAQITQNGDTHSQSLHIVSDNDVAQLAAHLTQHGVIVRSAQNVSGDPSQQQQGQQQQHLIVSSAQLDARTGQLLMTESQAAQIIADAEALQQSRSQLNDNTITLQSAADQNLLSSENVIHFNNRTAVIQIQHAGPPENIQLQHSTGADSIQIQHATGTDNLQIQHAAPDNIQIQQTDSIQIQHTSNSDNISNQQVITIPEQQVAHLTGQPIQNSGNVHVTELQHSGDINHEIEPQETPSTVQQFIQEEQIVSSIGESNVENTYEDIEM